MWKEERSFQMSEHENNWTASKTGWYHKKPPPIAQIMPMLCQMSHNMSHDLSEFTPILL